MTWNVGPTFNPTHVSMTVLVGMRKYKAAVDASDVAGQAYHTASLDKLDPDWLTTVYAEWQTAGFPPIG